jgi:multiple antibiotic resistance protein
LIKKDIMVETILTAVIAFTVTINPIGAGVVFAGLTHSCDRKSSRHMAIRGTVIATVVLLAFALGGEVVLAALGISFEGLRIAGGILLLLLAIDMVFAKSSEIGATAHLESAEASTEVGEAGCQDISAFPLAIPLIAGPGAITTTLLLLGRSQSNLTATIAVITVLLSVLAITLLVLLFAVEVARWLGASKVNVLNRVLGILLAALACQFMLDGVMQAIMAIVRSGASTSVVP